MNDGRIIPAGEVLPAMDGPTDGHNGRTCRGAKQTGKPRIKPKRSAGGAVRRRFALLNAFADWAVPGRSRAELAAWLLLFRHARPDGTVSASVGDLARRAGCGERAMRYGLARLQNAGLLERVKRGTPAGGPSVWRLLWPDSATPDRHEIAG